MPDEPVDLRELDPGLAVIGIEQAQLYPVGGL